ncbi:MAG: hypothetical protein ACRCY9_15340 [Phycicoccus sp.]
MSRDKVSFSTQVDADVAVAVRATVLALQRIVGPTVSLSSFTTDALAAAVRDAQDRYNNGRPFGPTDHKLLTGPRLTRSTAHPRGRA